MGWLKVFLLLVGLANCRRPRTTPAVPTVTALIGQGVMIPCSIPHRPTGLNESRIYWQASNPRSKKPHEDMVLLVYNRGKMENNLRTALYMNRTRLFPGQLHDGNFSLYIDPVKIEDDRAKVIVRYEKNDFKPLCPTYIRVTARNSKPAVHSSCTQGAGLVEVTCATQGGFPEPTFSWRIQNHTVLRPQEMTRTMERDPHSGTFSADLTVQLNASEGQTTTCLVTNPVLQETVSTSITIQSCKVDPQVNTASWLVPVALLVALVFVFLVALGAYRYGYGERSDVRSADSAQELWQRD
ncbi:CD276 antigen-like isoform X2 [Conger conger]|uniref:CD276 antigen-like isoform X2 n=1 Tax=Conger conger TaxID=82655 RepID=UPI002A5ADA23|nr:CD276 antigen-like isoform X2 [Conger conger]